MADSLAATFRTHAPGRDDDGPELEALLAERVASARAAWPMVELAPAELVRQLALRCPRDRPALSWLREVRVEELYLACACAVAEPAAIAAFDARFLAPLGRHLHPLGRDAAFVDEVRQLVREKLLVAPPGQSPKIAEYAGLGPLDGGWLRVVATRVALDLLRRRDPEALRPSHVEVPDAGAGNPELGYLHKQYRALFQECLAGAVQALGAEGRNLLRMHFVDGVTLEQLAALFHTSRATLVRRIAAARATVLDTMRARVQERLRLLPEEFESLMAQFASQLDLSLATVL
jgi:RNA polymerase sigma-70 factor (ECF subfamily)